MLKPYGVVTLTAIIVSFQTYSNKFVIVSRSNETPNFTIQPYIYTASDFKGFTQHGWEPLVLFSILVLVSLTECRRYRYRKPIERYPKDTNWWATDFFVTGCQTFIQKCPVAYKNQIICARSYDGDYRMFDNYCFMQYENCNTWRNWHVFKRERC